MIKQEIINRLQQHGLERSKNKDFAYERIIHNAQLQDLIAELSKDLDE